jgi:hypothetical protein
MEAVQVIQDGSLCDMRMPKEARSQLKGSLHVEEELGLKGVLTLPCYLQTQLQYSGNTGVPAHLADWRGQQQVPSELVEPGVGWLTLDVSLQQPQAQHKVRHPALVLAHSCTPTPVVTCS